jgi:hypothetical protein
VGRPSRSLIGSGAAKSSSRGSLVSRRAANPRACLDAWSSQCAWSMTQISGRSAADSDSRPSTARPARKRSGAVPARMPNAISSASRWGPGRRPSRSSIVPHSRCSPPKASSVSDCAPATRTTWKPASSPAAKSSSAVFPVPGSPCTTSTALPSSRMPSTSLASRPHSAWRPCSLGNSVFADMTPDCRARALQPIERPSACGSGCPRADVGLTRAQGHGYHHCGTIGEIPTRSGVLGFA